MKSFEDILLNEDGPILRGKNYYKQRHDNGGIGKGHRWVTVHFGPFTDKKVPVKYRRTGRGYEEFDDVKRRQFYQKKDKNGIMRHYVIRAKLADREKEYDGDIKDSQCYDVLRHQQYAHVRVFNPFSIVNAPDRTKEEERYNARHPVHPRAEEKWSWRKIAQEDKDELLKNASFKHFRAKVFGEGSEDYKKNAKEYMKKALNLYRDLRVLSRTRKYAKHLGKTKLEKEFIDPFTYLGSRDRDYKEDLINKYDLTGEQVKMLDEFMHEMNQKAHDAHYSARMANDLGDMTQDTFEKMDRKKAKEAQKKAEQDAKGAATPDGFEDNFLKKAKPKVLRKRNGTNKNGGADQRSIGAKFRQVSAKNNSELGVDDASNVSPGRKKAGRPTGSKNKKSPKPGKVNRNRRSKNAEG